MEELVVANEKHSPQGDDQKYGNYRQQPEKKQITNPGKRIASLLMKSAFGAPSFASRQGNYIVSAQKGRNRPLDSNLMVSPFYLCTSLLEGSPVPDSEDSAIGLRHAGEDRLHSVSQFVSQQNYYSIGTIITMILKISSM